MTYFFETEKDSFSAGKATFFSQTVALIMIIYILFFYCSGLRMVADRPGRIWIFCAADCPVRIACSRDNHLLAV